MAGKEHSLADPFDIEVKDAYILVRPHPGTVVNQELMVAMFHQLRALEAYRQDKEADLWDFRGCDTDLHYEDIARLMDDVRAGYDPHWTHERTAVVVDADLLYGLSRVYQALVSEFPIDIEIFRDVDRAVAWLESKQPPPETA